MVRVDVAVEAVVWAPAADKIRQQSRVDSLVPSRWRDDEALGFHLDQDVGYPVENIHDFRQVLVEDNSRPRLGAAKPRRAVRWCSSAGGGRSRPRKISLWRLAADAGLLLTSSGPAAGRRCGPGQDDRGQRTASRNAASRCGGSNRPVASSGSDPTGRIRRPGSISHTTSSVSPYRPSSTLCSVRTVLRRPVAHPPR
jgi:hypothetical protein